MTWRCFRKGILENFVQFTRKRLCWGLFFNNVAGCRAAVIPSKCFAMTFAKFLRTPMTRICLKLAANNNNTIEKNKLMIKMFGKQDKAKFLVKISDIFFVMGLYLVTSQQLCKAHKLLKFF